MHTHHLGMRERYSVARESVDADTAEGWISRGSAILQFVPTRLLPKNEIAQSKWRLGHKGQAVRVQKWRVTTATIRLRLTILIPGTPRYPKMTSAMSHSDDPTVGTGGSYPPFGCEELGVRLPGDKLKHVAIWTLDLNSAHRRVGAARQEWSQQCFIWHDAVRLDSRCEFGSAHLVDLFQRLSSFVMAVARTRIRAYDAAHPYGARRGAWREKRREAVGDDSCSFADIYLDDGFGITCGDRQPLRGLPEESDPVALELELGAHGYVRIHLHACLSRPETHLAIVRRTFQEAG